MEHVERASAVKVLPSGLVSRRDAASYLGRQSKTLALWAARNIGPRPRLINGRAFYVLEELQSFATGEVAA